MKITTFVFSGYFLALLLSCNSAQIRIHSEAGTEGGVHADLTADAGILEGDEYWDGPYLCCAKGSGTTCCAGMAQGFCFSYGGIYEACISEGQEREGKVTCGHCCAGLVAVSMKSLVSNGMGGISCQTDAPPSLLRCTRCGDGECGIGENRCNCLVDCL